MAQQSKFFGRKYILTLDLPDVGEYIFETIPGEPAMDIKFDVSYARGQTAREGTVSILGLGVDLINKFIALSAELRGKAMAERIRVKLEAGYFTSAGTVEIFDGFAWYASVTAPPQRWLTINVSEYDPSSGKSFTVGEIKNTNLKVLIEEILKKVSDAEGCEYELLDKTEEQILSKETAKEITFKDKVNLGEVIQRLNREVSDKVQFILRTSGQSDGVRSVEALDKSTEKVVDEDVEIDGNNGLLSVTGISAIQGCITTFIDGTIPDELCRLHLTSELNPQASGTYLILRKQYVGHFMGNEWYVRYFCSDKRKDE